MLHSFQQKHLIAKKEESKKKKKRGIHIINSKTLPVISTKAGFTFYFPNRPSHPTAAYFLPLPLGYRLAFRSTHLTHFQCHTILSLEYTLFHFDSYGFFEVQLSSYLFIYTFPDNSYLQIP